MKNDRTADQRAADPGVMNRICCSCFRSDMVAEGEEEPLLNLFRLDHKPIRGQAAPPDHVPAAITMVQCIMKYVNNEIILADTFYVLLILIPT